jgi:hypothetical protein
VVELRIAVYTTRDICTASAGGVGSNSGCGCGGCAGIGGRFVGAPGGIGRAGGVGYGAGTIGAGQGGSIIAAGSADELRGYHGR